MKGKKQERFTTVALSVGFMLAVSIFARTQHFIAPNVTTVILLGIAAFRLGRMVSYDLVFEHYREPFVVTVKDGSGAGDSTAPRYEHGWRHVIGCLLVCPVCVGTWIAAMLVAGLNIAPWLTQPFVVIFAVVGIAEFLNGLHEHHEWSGQHHRELAGASRRHKEKHPTYRYSDEEMTNDYYMD